MIDPLLVLNVNPAGRLGSIAHVATAPPALDIVIAPMAVPRVSEILVTEAVSAATGSSMVMETLVDAAPPELLAQMVNVVEVMFTVGVPLMVPDTVLKESPAGRLGSIAHDSTMPPELVMMTDVMVTLRVRFTELADAVIEARGSLIVIKRNLLAEPPELFAYTL